MTGVSDLHLILTGATGFVGSKVVEECIRRQIRVTCLVRRFPPLDSPVLQNPNVRIVKFVLGEELTFKFSRNDVLLHLAWDHLDDYSSEHHVENLLPKHIRFLKACLSKGCKRIIGVGTCAEHSDIPLSTISDAHNGVTNCYAVAKAALSAVMQKHCASAEVEFGWARIWYVYGREQRAKSLCGAILAADKRGDTTFVPATPLAKHDFIHVQDAASKLVDLSLSDAVGSFEICSGRFESVFDFANRFVLDENLNIKIM